MQEKKFPIVASHRVRYARNSIIMTDLIFSFDDLVHAVFIMHSSHRDKRNIPDNAICFTFLDHTN